MYYPNLEAELKRKNIRRIYLAKALGLALSTISDKLTGKSDISLSLAKKIKDFLGVDTPLEVLFATEGNKVA